MTDKPETDSVDEVEQTSPPAAALEWVTFGDLQIGEKFRFYADGSLVTKVTWRTYDAPQWGQFGNHAPDIDQPVIREQLTGDVL